MKPLDAQNVIAKRIAGELREGMLVNLGIGTVASNCTSIPTAFGIG